MPSSTALARGALSFGGFVRGVEVATPRRSFCSISSLLLSHGSETQGRTCAARRARPRGRRARSRRGVLFLGGSIDGAHLDEALLLRLPDSASEMVSLELLSGGGTSSTAAGRAVARPRAHGTALAVPPYVLHVGGAYSDADPPIDLLHCPSDQPTSEWSWTSPALSGATFVPSTTDRAAHATAARLSASRFKHSLVALPRAHVPQGCSASAYVWGGDEKGHADLGSDAADAAAASKQRCSQLLRLDVMYRMMQVARQRPPALRAAHRLLRPRRIRPRAGIVWTKNSIASSRATRARRRRRTCRSRINRGRSRMQRERRRPPLLSQQHRPLRRRMPAQEEEPRAASFVDAGVRTALHAERAAS